MELNAETRSVANVFTLNKKYVVPRFQREYSWQQDQLEEFWDDIVQQIRVAGSKASHSEYFIGAVVLVGEDSKPDYLIVDGQQRLTTLTLLLRAIVDRLNTLKETKAAAALHENVIEGKDHEGNRYFKLLNESPKPFFQNELQALTPQQINKPETSEEILLKNAFEFFKKKIPTFKPKGLTEIEAAKALRDQVLDYLKFILVTAKSEDDAYTIFETLNARGISLSSVDLVKNWIFKNYSDVHPNDNAKDIWAKIRKKVSSFSSLETFFRHYWNSKYAFASDDRLYKSFKDALKKKQVAGPKEFLLELRDAAETYRKIGAPKDSDWRVQKEKPIKNALSLLVQYKVTQPRPFLIALLECRRIHKSIDQTKLVSTIRSIENFHFIFSNICQERASGLESKYTRAAKQLFAAGSDKIKADAVIKKLIADLKAKRPGTTKLATSLANLTFGSGNDGQKKTIQTIFAKVEAHLLKTSELEVSAFSLEHVKDQSSKASWACTLGNLIPLDEKINNGIKSGASFKDKKLKYSKSKLQTTKHFLSKNPQDKWEKKEADAWLSELTTLLDKATAL